MTLKQISQEAFDEMVRENMDALGLEPEEALEATVEELKLQGVDTTTIVKCLPGASLDAHPIAQATRRLTAKTEDMADALQSLDRALRSGDASDNAIAVALKEGTLDVLLELLKTALSCQEATLLGQATAHLLSRSPKMRTRFLELDGAEAYLMAVKERISADGEREIAPLLRVVAASCKKCESAKCKFMKDGFVEALHVYLKGLAEKGGSAKARSVAGAFSVLTSLTNPDDSETSASQTFMHARLLAQQKLHLSVLQVLQTQIGSEMREESVISGLNALRCLAANDDICKELSESGGVALCLQLLSASPPNPLIVKTTCNTLRQLSCSDAVKVEIVKHQGASTFASLLASFARDAEIMEGLLGLMALIALRQPQFARAFCEAHCHDRIYQAFLEFAENPKVLRQCCACIRNFVVRDDALKRRVLDLGLSLRSLVAVDSLPLGVAPLIRQCKGRFPIECADDASSALRDLGFDDYL